MDDYSHAPYYNDQSEWDHNDFYQLNRYLSRLITFAARRMDEIKSIDLSKMSIETKTLLYVIIKFQNKNSLLNLDNLSELKMVQPLKKRLSLVDNPLGIHELYDRYNIGW